MLFNQDAIKFKHQVKRAKKLRLKIVIIEFDRLKVSYKSNLDCANQRQQTVIGKIYGHEPLVGKLMQNISFVNH